VNTKQVLNFKLRSYRNWRDDNCVRAINKNINMQIDLKPNGLKEEFEITNLRTGKQKSYCDRIPKQYQTLYDSMKVYGALIKPEDEEKLTIDELISMTDKTYTSRFLDTRRLKYSYPDIDSDLDFGLNLEFQISKLDTLKTMKELQKNMHHGLFIIDHEASISSSIFKGFQKEKLANVHAIEPKLTDFEPIPINIDYWKNPFYKFGVCVKATQMTQEERKKYFAEFEQRVLLDMRDKLCYYNIDNQDEYKRIQRLNINNILNLKFKRELEKEVV
jgi:hypothetical protein